MISKKSVFLPVLYVKLLELSVEVAFYNGSAVACYIVDLLKCTLQSSCSKRIDDAFVCFFFFWVVETQTNLSRCTKCSENQIYHLGPKRLYLDGH